MTSISDGCELTQHERIGRKLPLPLSPQFEPPVRNGFGGGPVATSLVQLAERLLQA